jgi:hypothetical protein
MGVTRVSKLVQQPCFGLLKVDGKWHQVKVFRYIREGAGEMNEVQMPDGTSREVRCDRLKFDGRRKRFVPHPECKAET